MHPDGPKLLTINEAARLLGVHQNTLRTWADKGLVPHVKLPSGHRRFRSADIERLQREWGLVRDKDASTTEEDERG